MLNFPKFQIKARETNIFWNQIWFGELYSINIHLRLKFVLWGESLSLKCVLIEFAIQNLSLISTFVYQKNLKPAYKTL